MEKHFHLAGVRLKNISTREALNRVDRAFYEERFLTLGEVNRRTLYLAWENPVVRNLIEELDVTIIGESEILEVAKEQGLRRQFEIDNRVFFYQFYRRMERSNRKVLLLGETTESVMKAVALLREEFPKLNICKAYSLERYQEDEDAVVNDINAASTDVIVSVLPSPRQEYFLATHKNKLAAILWYGMGEEKFRKPKYQWCKEIVKRYRVYKLKQYIRRYEKGKEI